MSTVTTEARRLCRQINEFRGTQWSGRVMHIRPDGTLAGDAGRNATESPFVRIPWANEPRMTQAGAAEILDPT